MIIGDVWIDDAHCAAVTRAHARVGAEKELKAPTSNNEVVLRCMLTPDSRQTLIRYKITANSVAGIVSC
jgi:hypothetical protein